MLLALHGDFWEVDRHRVVHLIVLKVLFNEKSNQFRVSVLVHLARHGVLPLEARRLLCVRVCIALDGLEDLCSKLSSQASKGSLLLQILNHDVFEVVHDDNGGNYV